MAEESRGSRILLLLALASIALYFAGPLLQPHRKAVGAAGDGHEDGRAQAEDAFKASKAPGARRAKPNDDEDGFMENNDLGSPSQRPSKGGRSDGFDEDEDEDGDEDEDAFPSNDREGGEEKTDPISIVFCSKTKAVRETAGRLQSGLDDIFPDAQVLTKADGAKGLMAMVGTLSYYASWLALAFVLLGADRLEQMLGVPIPEPVRGFVTNQWYVGGLYILLSNLSSFQRATGRLEILAGEDLIFSLAENKGELPDLRAVVSLLAADGYRVDMNAANGILGKRAFAGAGEAPTFTVQEDDGPMGAGGDEFY